MGKSFFASAKQVQEFNRLSQNIESILNEIEEFEKQGEAELQSLPDRIKQFT